MDKDTLRTIVPFVKQYAKGRGKGVYQSFPVPSDHHNMNNAPAALITKTGNITPSSCQYCYFSINNNSTTGIQAIALQLQPCPKDLDAEAYRHYIDWVLNWSPWRSIFVTKNINKAMRDGVVIVDPTSPGNLMIDGMIALRQAWDCYSGLARYKQIGVWWELIQKNSPIISFAVISNLIYITRDGGMAMGINHAGHSPFRQNDMSLDNFVKGTMVEQGLPWINKRGARAWNLWDTSVPGDPIDEYDDESPNQSKLATLVSTVLNNIGKTKAKVNTFAAEDKQKLFTRANVIDCLNNELGNMEKEIVGN